MWRKLTEFLGADRQVIDSTSRARWPFYVMVGGVGLFGLLLALWAADPKSDIWREVGAAIMTGAVLALVIVWFEERMDDRRATRARLAANRSARLDWQRDVDFRLYRSVVSGEFSRCRSRWLKDLERQADDEPDQVMGDRETERFRQLVLSVDDIDTLVSIRRDQSLEDAWSDWLVAYHSHLQHPEKPGRDAEAHVTTKAAEVAAYQGLRGGLDELIADQYPVE